MINKMILVGNVGQSPKIRDTKTGGRVASFSIATTERWKDKNTGERKERTEWHNVVVFNDGLVAIVEQHIKKGTKLYVEGTHRTRTYNDRDGKECRTSECVLQGWGNVLCLIERMSAGASTPPPVDDMDAYGSGDQREMSISDEIMETPAP